MGTDNVPLTPITPQPFFYGEVTDVGSQASPAQPQAVSRVAKAYRSPVPAVPPALPQLRSTSQARPPSLFPLHLTSTRTRRHRRQAVAAAGSPRPAVDYGLDRTDPVPPPARPLVATARLPRRPPLPSPSSERPACLTDSAPTAPIGSAAAATEPVPPILGVQSSYCTPPAPFPETPTPAELEFRESAEHYSHADRAREQHAEPACDAATRNLPLGSCVLSDDFLLHI